MGKCQLAACLDGLGRYDEALVLQREIYAREVATLGASHEDTIGTSCNIASSLWSLKLWDDAIKMYRDQALPTARQSRFYAQQQPQPSPIQPTSALATTCV